ncbi:MAG: hypothetical protein L7F78_16355, partial [Syntrophales bacterium LBB04]|nr:hypothetical protein [Syntrophales bacterium LBB04]
TSPVISILLPSIADGSTNTPAPLRFLYQCLRQETEGHHPENVYDTGDGQTRFKAVDLDMFEETYLVYLVPRRGKLNESLLSPKKVYAADLGIRNLFTGFKDKGALFENYVYLMIKPLEPRYVYEDGNELDFYTRDGVLIEAKYGTEMSVGQKALFERLQATQKLLVHSVHDLETLKALTH